MRDEITLTLNQRTIMEAVQAYLDKHFTPPMQLTEFTTTTATGYNASNSYTCKLKEIADEGAKS